MKLKYIAPTAALAAATAILAVAGCKGSSNDNKDAKMLALAYLATANQTTPAASRAVVGVQNSVSSVGSTIASAAKNGTVAMSAVPNRLQMMAMMRRKGLGHILSTEFAGAIPTTTSITQTGGTCNSTGCNATLNGTADCAKGGTATLTNLAVNMTFPSNAASGSYSFSTSMKGTVTLNSCATLSQDWMNFPGLATSVSSGSLTIDGTQGMNITSSTMTSSNSGIMDFTYTDTSTVNSTAGLTINGTSTGAISNMVSAVNLAVHDVVTNMAQSVSGTTFTFSGEYTDTLTGTYKVTGTVGSDNVSVTKTYNGNVFHYKVACTMDMSSSSSTSSSCTVTNL